MTILLNSKSHKENYGSDMRLGRASIILVFCIVRAVMLEGTISIKKLSIRKPQKSDNRFRPLSKKKLYPPSFIPQVGALMRKKRHSRNFCQKPSSFGFSQFKFRTLKKYFKLRLAWRIWKNFLFSWELPEECSSSCFEFFSFF